MFTNCLLVLALSPCAAVDSEAVVTSYFGQVVVERGDGRYRVVHGAGLQSNDRIRVNEDAGVSFYLPGEHVVYLGTRCEATLIGAPGAWQLILHQGEARVTSSSRESLTIRAAWGQAAVYKGIVRALVDERQSQFFVERGEVKVAAHSDMKYVLAEGDGLTLASGGAQRTAREAEWTIRAADYQLAAAIAAQPELSPPQDVTPPGSPALPQPDSSTEDPATEEDVPSEEDELRDEELEEETEEPPPDANEVALNTNVGVSSSASLGSLASSLSGFSSSGGLFSDANQQTLQGRLTQDAPQLGLSQGDPFRGAIHLVTAENRYQFNSIQLTLAEQQQIFGNSNNAYWSIGTGPVPTSQVTTDLQTGSNPAPNTVNVPGFNAYLLRLDQFGIPDPAVDPVAAEQSNVGFSGYIGQTPLAPTITGATPLADTRAEFNQKVTFALGEFRISKEGDSIGINIRRSDQDRTIVKDPGGNDALDQVTVNPQISEYRDVADPRFQPQIPTVKVPGRNAFDSTPNRFSNLSFLRKAATTTLMADQLHDFARRTGQTRFVVREADGTRSIIDITGYQKP